MPAPLFRRFVPPTSATEEQSSASASSPAPAPAATKAANRKETKPKMSKQGAGTVKAVAVPPEVSEDVSMEDVPAETPKSVKRSKKRKSEVIEEQDGQDEDVSKKHKGVLSKFEKAQKLAEARKEQPEVEVEVEQSEEELHGKHFVRSVLPPLTISSRPPAYAATSARA